MTDSEREQLEEDAETMADELAILLLLLLIKKGKRVVRGPLSRHTIEWRADVGKFYVDGRAVSEKQVRSYLAKIESRLTKEFETLGDELERGEIAPAEWGREFEREITAAHVLAAALAVGSIEAALRNNDFVERLDRERGFIRNFRRQVRRNKAGSLKMITARAKRYLIAINITHAVVSQKVREVVGIQTECRRIVRSRETSPDCLELARRGWMPIAEMPPIGSVDCGWRCRCYLEFR